MKRSVYIVFVIHTPSNHNYPMMLKVYNYLEDAKNYLLEQSSKHIESFIKWRNNNEELSVMLNTAGTLDYQLYIKKVEVV